MRGSPLLQSPGSPSRKGDSNFPLRAKLASEFLLRESWGSATGSNRVPTSACSCGLQPLRPGGLSRRWEDVPKALAGLWIPNRQHQGSCLFRFWFSPAASSEAIGVLWWSVPPWPPQAAALFPELFPSGPAVLNLAVPGLIMCSEPLLQQQAFCAEAAFANPPYTCHQ